MKKIFTLMAAMAATTMAWAEAPVLLFQGEPVEEGKTYETGYELEAEMELAPGTVLKIYKQNSDLSLKGKVGETAVVEVKATDLVQVCTFGGCTMVTEITKEDVLKEEVTDLLIDIETTDTDGVDPATLMKDVTVEVTAYYKSSPADKATAKVTMTNKPASEIGGISNVTVGNTQIALRGNTLDYNVNQPSKLDIYNVNGSLVISQKIYATGSISLDSFHPGVYIYSANGVTGKILVRK